MKAITLYRPGDFGPKVLENVFGDFDRYLDSFFGNNFLSPSDRIFNHLPSVDVRETDKAYVLEAELPGYDEKDIEVHLDGNNLYIESRKEDEKTGNSTEKTVDGNYLLRERRTASFSRSFKLPENADTEGIAASFRNGILSLEIGKKAEAQARVIQITNK